MNIIKCECGQICQMEFDCQICKACGKVNTRKRENLTSPETIEQEARRLIGGDRKDDYGSAKDNFSNTALIWTGILRARFKNCNLHLDAQTVALMMAAFKLCREANKDKRDNRVDAIGYLLLEDQILCPPFTT